MGKHHSLSWWRSTVTTWLASGRPSREFAPSVGVDASTLRSYRRRFGLPFPDEEPAAPMQLVHVEVETAPVHVAAGPTSAARQSVSVFVRVGPAELDVAVGTDPAWVAALITAIGKAATAC